tara:strand:+ start:540 stop:1223 length:684 start_codon:yes stop_codon:yes gene_type:complete
MKKLLATGLIALSLGACASTSTTEYYEAMERAALAQAKVQEARYNALSRIAGEGNEAATAAVMALAMTNQTPIIPQAQKSTALQWAQVLSGPVSSLGAMWLSNDATKSMARFNRDTQIANIKADQVNTTQLYGLLGSNSDNLTSMGLGGFNALNTSMEYMDNSDITFPDYSTNFSNIDDYLLQIINNLNTSSDEDNQIWVPGVNCVSAGNGIIGVGSSGSAIPICPQ